MTTLNQLLGAFADACRMTEYERSQHLAIFHSMETMLVTEFPQIYRVVLTGSLSRSTALAGRSGYNSDIDCFLFMRGLEIGREESEAAKIRSRLRDNGYTVKPGEAAFVSFEYEGVDVDCVIVNDFNQTHENHGEVNETGSLPVMIKPTSWTLENEDALERYSAFEVATEGEEQHHRFANITFGDGAKDADPLGVRIELGYPLLFNAFIPSCNIMYGELWILLIVIIKFFKREFEFNINSFHIEYNVFDVLKNLEFLPRRDHFTFLELLMAFLEAPAIVQDTLLNRDIGFLHFRRLMLEAGCLARAGRDAEAIAFLFNDIRFPD